MNANRLKSERKVLAQPEIEVTGFQQASAVEIFTFRFEDEASGAQRMKATPDSHSY